MCRKTETAQGFAIIRWRYLVIHYFEKMKIIVFLFSCTNSYRFLPLPDVDPTDLVVVVVVLYKYEVLGRSCPFEN